MNILTNCSRGAILVGALFMATVGSFEAQGARGNNNKDIPLDVFIDPVHYSLDPDDGRIRIPTEISPSVPLNNGIQGDGLDFIAADSRTVYSKSSNISAFTGRSKAIWLSFSEMGRWLGIDLSQPAGCTDSNHRHCQRVRQ